MTKGCKIWLWIMLVINVLSLVVGVVSLSTLGINGIYSVIAEVIIIVSVCLLLFKRKKVGFYILVVVCVINLVVNIMNGANIVISILSAVISPALTFFFISKNQDAIK